MVILTLVFATVGNMTSQRVFFTLLSSLLIPACWPGQISDGGEISPTADSETGLGDGDGDSGDGDGDMACEAPTVACSDGCWASSPTWTAEAEATVVNGIIEPGVWVPVDLGLDAECWELDGVGTHVCVVDVCGVHLLGHPANEMAFDQPGSECDFTGVWSSTATAGGLCFGLVNGVAVELRGGESCTAAAHIEFAEVSCTASGCEGRWQETDLWSTVFSADEILMRPVVAADLWPCQSDPQVDVCVEVDGLGHKGCFWVLDGWAVPVAPCCAVADWGWLPIGEGMAAAAAGH
jgi:hypothetical protein